MKKLFLFIFCILLTVTPSYGGSCPMLWGKVDNKIQDVTDKDLKDKIIKLRDLGKKAHSDGNHSDSEKLLNEALDLLAG